MSGSDLCHFHVETFNWWCSWQTSFFLLQWSWNHEASVILGPSETKLNRDPCWPILDTLHEWEITLDGVIEIWGLLHYHMLIHNIAHLDCYKKPHEIYLFDYSIKFYFLSLDIPFPPVDEFVKSRLHYL